MLKDKTAKRLVAAIKTVEELKIYLQRAHRKLTTESAEVESDEGLRLWLTNQAEHWRRRRDAELKSSETYRFFHGKSEGFQAVIRHLEEESGAVPTRAGGDKGYLSARNSSTSDPPDSLKATDAMSDTFLETRLA